MNYSPEILISEEEIDLRLDFLARKIEEDFNGEEVTFVCVLKGAFVFCADLIRRVNLPCKIEFMTLSSYGDGMESSGNVRLKMDINDNLHSRNIVVVEDIVDSGRTVKFLKEYFSSKELRALKFATLLYKPSKDKFKTQVDYLGFEIDDKFVVGMGLDYAGRYRELPYVGVLNAGN